MSNLLESLMGSGQKKQEYGDFINRYEQGAPWEGISDDEAISRHDEIESNISSEEVETSVQEEFGRIEPQDQKD